MALERLRAIAYRQLCYGGFTGIRHNLPFIRGNPDGSRAHHEKARIIAERMQRLAAASALDFRGFDETAFWNLAIPLDPEDNYLRPYCDRARFESLVDQTRRTARLPAQEQRSDAVAMPPTRMAAYRSLIEASFGAIRRLLASDPNPDADSVMRRVAIAIADRMHNVAAFSAADFVGFDEDRFWSEDASSTQSIHPFVPTFTRSFVERER